jgi:hypothetical protein
MRRLHRRTGTTSLADTCSSSQASPKHIAKNAGPLFFFVFLFYVRGPNDALADTFYTGMTRCFYFVFIKFVITII